jgi:hypothetical protein
MSDTIIVILVASAAGALFGPPGYALGRWLERRYWPRKPPAPPTARMQLRGIKLPCPNCGKEIGADIEIEGPFPPSNDPAALKAAGLGEGGDPFNDALRYAAEARRAAGQWHGHRYSEFQDQLLHKDMNKVTRARIEGQMLAHNESAKHFGAIASPAPQDSRDAQ